MQIYLCHWLTDDVWDIVFEEQTRYLHIGLCLFRFITGRYVSNVFFFFFLPFDDYAVQLMKTQALSSPVLLVSWIFCFTVVYRVSPGVLLWVYWPIKHVALKPAIGREIISLGSEVPALKMKSASPSTTSIKTNSSSWHDFCCFSNDLWGVLASMWTRPRPFQGSGHHYRFVELIRMCKVFYFSGKSLENKSLSRDSQPRWH